MELDKYIQGISETDVDFENSGRAHWDSRTHPVGSLGALEEYSIRLAGIQRRKIPRIRKKSILVMCADNGVVKEDVSSSPPVFTQLLANAMARGETGVCALAKHNGAKFVVIDVGMEKGIEREAGICDASVRAGTGNIATEDAMTREEAVQAIGVGIRYAEAEIEDGADILGTGELGIGNTTTASALLYILSGEAPEACVGYGAGITDAQWQKKVRAVCRAKARLDGCEDAIDILAKSGGLDIAALAGVFLAGAYHRVPVVCDGLISGVAAYLAIQMAPLAKGYIFPSHRSAELAASVLYRVLDITPPLDLHMRLGEGSGCPLFFSLLESAIACMESMGSFEANQIDPAVLVSLRKDTP